MSGARPQGPRQGPGKEQEEMAALYGLDPKPPRQKAQQHLPLGGFAAPAAAVAPSAQPVDPELLELYSVKDSPKTSPADAPQAQLPGPGELAEPKQEADEFLPLGEVVEEEEEEGEVAEQPGLLIFAGVVKEAADDGCLWVDVMPRCSAAPGCGGDCCKVRPRVPRDSSVAPCHSLGALPLPQLLAHLKASAALTSGDRPADGDGQPQASPLQHIPLFAVPGGSLVVAEREHSALRQLPHMTLLDVLLRPSLLSAQKKG